MTEFVWGVFRSLTESESELAIALFHMIRNRDDFRADLSDARVREMGDGGMRSLLFTATSIDRKAHEVASATAVDEDSVPLETSLNLDQNDALFELDIWRVDFSPLRRLPLPEELHRA